MKKVKITKSSRPNSWYDQKKGKIFEVDEVRNEINDFVVIKGDFKGCPIDPRDCDIIIDNHTCRGNMKSKFQESKQKPEYPCFMRGKISGIIILMQEEGKGTVVVSNPRYTSYPIGKILCDLDMDNLERVSGSITITID
jgi:hypothetical protein